MPVHRGMDMQMGTYIRDYMAVYKDMEKQTQTSTQFREIQGVGLIRSYIPFPPPI